MEFTRSWNSAGTSACFQRSLSRRRLQDNNNKQKSLISIMWQQKWIRINKLYINTEILFLSCFLSDNIPTHESCSWPEFGLAFFVEAVDEAVGLALQRPPQGDAAPAAQLLGVPDETLHGLRETHELRRAETLQRAVLLETMKQVASKLHKTSLLISFVCSTAETHQCDFKCIYMK